MRRWPPLVLIVALLVGALVVDHERARDQAAAVPSAPDPAGLLPVGLPDDALGSIWFCAGQTAGDDTRADGTVVVANLGPDHASGRIEVVGDDGERASQALEVAAASTERVRLADVLTADWVAARVELDRGHVVVEHEVAGPEGRDVAACHNRADDTWYLPSGATTRDARMTVAIYNPYADEDVVDLSFVTGEGQRRPRDLQDLPIPARSVVAVDVTSVVTVREILATTVSARRGRVVVDRIQTYDGRGASATEEEAAAEAYRRTGLTVTPAVPRPRPVWRFPAGVKSPGIHERVVVFNPGRDEAEVEITVSLDDPRRNGRPEPFPLTVAGGDFEVFDLDAAPEVPPEVRHSLLVRTVSGPGVIAERSIDAEGAATYVGVATSTGSPVAARRWAFAAGPRPDGAEAARMVVMNPGSEEVDVRLVAFGDGRRAAVRGGGPFRLGPGDRREIVVETLLDDRGSVEVLASGPIVAERRLIASETAPDESSDESSDADAEPQPGMGASTTLGIPLGTVTVLG